MMQKNSVLIIGLTLLVWGSSIAATRSMASEDSRQMVKLPKMMQQHMLANMRDHLVALNEIFGELANGNADKAGEIAEKRLGMSSMSLHGAAHLGKFMPAEMRAIGTNMHRTASQFVIIAKDAELDTSKTSQRKVFKALQDITANCNACHQGYRIQ